MSPVRNILEEIQQNAQDESGSWNRNGDLPEDEEGSSEFGELTDLERQIVAKYLRELEGSEGEGGEMAASECDLNNNCKNADAHAEEDKENRAKNFPTSANDDLTTAATSMAMFLRKWPQLNRSTSLESTGDSVEDLVSACPPYVHYLKPLAAAAQSSTPQQFQQLLVSAVAESTLASPCTLASTTCTPPSPSNPASSYAATTAGTPSNYGNSTINRRDEPTKMGGSNGEQSGVDRKRRYTDLARTSSSSVASPEADSNGGGIDYGGDKAKKDKTVKRRPNYSVWMGVTSCIWGLLFYLMKSYL